MWRRLQVIILAHIWALAPIALAWFAVPAWRGPLAPVETGGLAVLAAAAAAYLLVRTWFTVVRWHPRLATAWPVIDTVLVTAALLLVRNPADPLSLLYFIPIAAAVAARSAGQVLLVIAAYLAVIVVSAAPLTIGLVFRLVVIGLLASLHGWITRLVAIAERARERAQYQAALAGEMHDGVQHLLVTMAARLELARALTAEAPDRAAQILAEERDAARRAADELRYLVRRLRAAAAQDELAAALRAQIIASAERWPFALRVEVPPTLPRLAPAAEHAVLRLIQESLTNAAKHARASTVHVRLEGTDGRLRCTVTDDGAGFTPGPPQAGGGLRGVEDRVRAAGGTFELRSAPGRGTTLTATFPVREDRGWSRSRS